MAPTATLYIVQAEHLQLALVPQDRGAAFPASPLLSLYCNLPIKRGRQTRLMAGIDGSPASKPKPAYRPARRTTELSIPCTAPAILKSADPTRRPHRSVLHVRKPRNSPVAVLDVEPKSVVEVLDQTPLTVSTLSPSPLRFEYTTSLPCHITPPDS